MADITQKLKNTIYATIKAHTSSAGKGPGSGNAFGYEGQGQGHHFGHGEYFNCGNNPVGRGFGYGPGPQSEEDPIVDADDYPMHELPLLDDALQGYEVEDDALLAIVNQVSVNYPDVEVPLIQKMVEDIWAYGYVASDDNDGKVLSVDFDGTIAEWAEYPSIGMPIPGAIQALNKLIAEGWKVIIYSNRASYPGGKEQIATWLEGNQLRVNAIIPKVYARWYVDDRAIEFRDNWGDIYKKMHYDVPVQISGPAITMASSIKAGRHSLKEITDYIGFDHKAFKQDMKKVYAEHTEQTKRVVENTFRNKYNLGISIDEIATCEDTEDYWREKLHAAVHKIEENLVERGDEVIILTNDSNFGKSGTLMDVGYRSAAVLIDGVNNDVVKISNYKDNLKLLKGHEKMSMLKVGSSDSIDFVKSEYYPDGLSNADVYGWYRMAGKELYSKIVNTSPVTLHRVMGSIVPSVKESAKDFDKEVNIDNLVSIHENVLGNTKVAVVKLQPTAGYSENQAKTITSDLVNLMAEMKDVEDIQVRFSGVDGYFIIATFNEAHPANIMNKRVSNTVNIFIDDINDQDIVPHSTLENKKLMIISGFRSVPAAYSVDSTTGLVCVPLDSVKIHEFNYKHATIHFLNSVYGNTNTMPRSERYAK